MQRPEAQTRTYLVTGGAGFIGSHLADVLLAEGNRIVALDDFSTGRMDNIAHLMDHPGFELVRGDITDADVVDELASGVDVLVHLAASVGVKLILEQPVRTIENNVVGTETVLKAARRHTRRRYSSPAPPRSTGRGAGSLSPRRTTSCSAPPPKAAGPTPPPR